MHDTDTTDGGAPTAPPDGMTWTEYAQVYPEQYADLIADHYFDNFRDYQGDR